jgi:hypothetical protein
MHLVRKSVYGISVYTEPKEDTMRQKKGLLRNVVDQYVDRWQVMHFPVPHIWAKLTIVGVGWHKWIYTCLRRIGSVAYLVAASICVSTTWERLGLTISIPRHPTGGIPDELLAGFNSLLFCVLPTTFPDALTAIFEATLDRLTSECESLFELLASFGVIRHFETLICRVSYRAIERKIAETCPEKWDESCLKENQEWVHKVLAPRSAHVYSFGECWSTSVQHFDIGLDPEMKVATYAGDHHISQKFEFHVYKTLCELR